MPKSGRDGGIAAAARDWLIWTSIAFAVMLVPMLTSAAAAQQASGSTESIWIGVYSETQATRGEVVYPSACGNCHGRKLDGAPEDPDVPSTRPVAGAKFLRDWAGKSLAVLFEYMRATMPSSNPGFLSDEEYADVIAYMLSVSGLPPGARALRSDSKDLARIVIEPRPQSP